MEREIFIEGQQLTGVRTVMVPTGAAVRSIAEQVAKLINVPAEALHVFKEDAAAPLHPDDLLDGEVADGIIHHVHQARTVQVTVNYQQQKLTQPFSPATRIQVILDWVVRSATFNVDPAIAPEMELAKAEDPSEEIPRTAHLGRYAAGRDHQVEFDLVRGVIPNGASPWIP